MNRTSNYNLGLWEGSDFPNYTMPNENMNIIDTNLKTVDERSIEAKSKADACITKIGNVDIQQMQTDVNINKVGVVTNKALIDKLEDSIGTITSPTNTEVGTRVVREVKASFNEHLKVNHIEGIFCYNATVEITPDRLGLESGDTIKVLSVNGFTSYKPQVNKGNYTIPVNYVGVNDNGNYCFCANGSVPSTNVTTDITYNTPTGFIIEYIKL